MKKLLSVITAFLITSGLFAQSDSEIAHMQRLWGKEKRAIAMDYMAVLPHSVFWQEYDAYELSRKELADERIEILTEYADNFSTLSDKKAADLINRSVSNNIAMQKLLLKTFKKMSKTVSSVEAAKFIQLENYFLTAIQKNIQESIPFLGELDDLIEE